MITTQIITHFCLPPKTIGIGPMKIIPATLLSVCPLPLLVFKLKKSIKAPIIISKSPNQSKGV